MIPEEFLSRMQQMLKEEYSAFLKSYGQEACHALRVNTLKCKKEEFLHQVPFQLEPVPWCDTGFYYDKDDRPGRHPYHDAGVYYMQEPSAMAPAVYLKAQPGERVLDLCGAPGGKTSQIAGDMRQQGILVCNEIHPGRAKILSGNVERMGIRNAIVTNETPWKLREAFENYFDRILVDAPCSGEGMFRKNEEACREWSVEQVRICADRQQEILSCAADMLRPGGRLVYSTCTFAPEEDEACISKFLQVHPEYEIVSVEKYPGMAPGELSYGQQKESELSDTIRLWPHKLRGEGHYLAVLQKGMSAEKQGRTKHRALQKGLAKKECKEYLDFVETQLANGFFSGVFLKFGEQLYLAPEQTPSLVGLKVLRPGLHLGTCRRGRLEPSHALALALPAEWVLHRLELPSVSPQIQEYLKGYTISTEGEKGWYLVTTDGYGIGWGKQSGSVIKNHYPKGLRKTGSSQS